MSELKTPDIELDDEGQVVDPQAVADLMAALERVFKIGVYYPSGHIMCDQAASHFLSSLERTLGKAPSLRFTLVGGVLHLQDMPLDADLRGVQSFKEILGNLGISGVVIDSNVTAGEMHQFVSQLLAYRNRIKGAHRFQQIVIEGMPLSIAIENLEFVSRDVENEEEESLLAGGDTRNPTMESLLTALARHGLGPEDLERCRKLLESIPGYLREQSMDGRAMPQVSWQDVEKLLVRAVQSAAEPLAAPTDAAPGGRTAGNVNLDSLTAIFKALGERAEAENPRHAIDLLLSLSRRQGALASADDGKPKPAPKVHNPADSMPMDELRAAIDACAVPEQAPLELAGGSRREELSILMQMLGREQKLPIQVRIQKRIRDIARTGLAQDEWAIAVAGMRELADPEQEERLFGPLLILTDALRASGKSSVLAFLRDICRDLDTAQIALLWPFLVNEILLEGRRHDTGALLEVCARAASLDENTMQSRLPRLESLSALRERRCARDAFTPPPQELYGVFSLILNSTHADFVGERLLDGMRHHPPNWLAEAVVPFLRRYQPKYRRFMIEVLKMRDDEEPNKSLLEAAGRVAADHLPALTFRNADQEWVPRTLRAMAALRVPGGQAILRNIVDQRRWFIIHAWPEPCRHAARDTLASWRERASNDAIADVEAPPPEETP